jgi:hypothetical protein
MLEVADLPPRGNELIPPPRLPNPANGCHAQSRPLPRRRRNPALTVAQSHDPLLYPLSYGGQMSYKRLVQAVFGPCSASAFECRRSRVARMRQAAARVPVLYPLSYGGAERQSSATRIRARARRRKAKSPDVTASLA